MADEVAPIMGIQIQLLSNGELKVAALPGQQPTLEDIYTLAHRVARDVDRKLQAQATAGVMMAAMQQGASAAVQQRAAMEQAEVLRRELAGKRR